VRRKILYRLLAVLLGLVVAFAAIEITLRLTLPPVDLEDLSGQRAGTHPMADWAYVDAYCAYRAIPGTYLHVGKAKTVNSTGFISTPEVSYEKDRNTIRIVFLGGSSTAGTVPILPDGKTWPALVAKQLDEALPRRKVDFINGALAGYTTFESYGRLWARLRFYRPDVVVVYHGWNDMAYFRNAASAAWRCAPADGGWSFERAHIRKRIQPSWIDPYIEWSHLMCRIRRRCFSEPLMGEIGPGGDGELANDFDPRAPDVFRDNLKLMMKAQEVLGCEVYVAKQATLIVRDLPENLRGKCMVHYHGFDFDAHVRAFDAIYRVIDEEIPKEQVIDLTHLSGKTSYLVDHIHLSEEGCRRVADAVAERLRNRLDP